MSTNQDTSTTQFITTKGPNGPSETKDPDDKPPTPGPDETKEPKETKDPDDKPPTPGPSNDETKEPKETKDPDDKPPTPEPDTTSGFSVTNTNYNHTDIDKSISSTTTTTTPITSTTDIYEPTWDLFDTTYLYETADETIDVTFAFDTDLLSTYDDPDTDKPTKPPKATKAPTTAKPTKAPKGTKAPTTPKPTKAPKEEDYSPPYNRTKIYEPKGSKESKDSFDSAVDKGGHPDVHTQLLTYKQSLGVISVVTVFLLIIFALLQILIHPDCRKNFKKGQLGNNQGKILFYSFVVALFFFLLNSVFFVHFIFNIDTLSESAYAIEEIFSMVPYRLGKLMMSVFFILRLHFVFKEAAFKINIYMIATLITSSVIGTILGCLGGIFGPLKLIKPQNGVNIATLIGVISLGITIIVDIIVMVLYNHRLHLVVLMQGELSRRTKSFRRRTTRGESVADMGLDDGPTTPKFSKLKSSTTEGIELQTQTQRRKGDTWTNVSNDEIELRKNTSIIPITPTADYDDLDDGGVLTDDDDDGYGEWEHFEVVETEVIVDALMVKTITKSTLLSLIGILTSFWLHIELLMMAIWTEDDGVRVRAIASVDGGINLICMYLVFAFAKPYYEIGCKLCHSTMQRCCRWSAKRAVVRSKSQSEISQL